jgi:predicted ester cyclase
MKSDETTLASSASRTPPTMTREELTTFFARRQEAYEDLDAATLAADYAPDAVIESPIAGVHDGRAAEVALRAVFHAFLDIKLTTDELMIDGDRVAQLLSISATHVGEFLGLAPTGKPFHLNAVFLYELKDGKIVRERRIYDFTGMLVRIGILKVKPI